MLPAWRVSRQWLKLEKTEASILNIKKVQPIQKRKVGAKGSDTFKYIFKKHQNNKCKNINHAMVKTFVLNV